MSAEPYLPQTPKNIRAATRLEELAADLPDIIRALREGDANGYGHVYHFRRRVSEVVVVLGSGNPLDPKRFDPENRPVKFT